MVTVTTIKLQKSTKSALDNLKANSESYDAAIKRLIVTLSNTNLKGRLIEAYKNMGKSDVQLLKEWEKASNEVEDYG